MSIPADETDPRRWERRDDFTLRFAEREALDEAIRDALHHEQRVHEVLLALRDGGRELHVPEQRALAACEAALTAYLAYFRV